MGTRKKLKGVRTEMEKAGAEMKGFRAEMNKPRDAMKGAWAEMKVVGLILGDQKET